MPARRKPKPAAKAKERVEPHFGGRKREGARKTRKPPARKSASADRPLRRAALRVLVIACAWVALMLGGGFLYFVSRLPDPALLTLDDRPPNLTILAADGTVLA